MSLAFIVDLLDYYLLVELTTAELTATIVYLEVILITVIVIAITTITITVVDIIKAIGDYLILKETS